MRLSMLAPTPHPLPGEVRQSWGFDLIRIQLLHPPGNVRIQILTGHALRVFRMRTLVIQYPDPWGKPAIPNKENSPSYPGWGRWGLTLIGALHTHTHTHTHSLSLSLSLSLPREREIKERQLAEQERLFKERERVIRERERVIREREYRERQRREQLEKELRERDQREKEMR